jgi:hypothetical protein
MSIVLPFRDARYMTIASGGRKARRPFGHTRGTAVVNYFE